MKIFASYLILYHPFQAEMKKLPQHDEVREMLYSLKDKLTVK